MKLAHCLLGALLSLAAAAAPAQSYPNKPIRIVVTFPPGGAPDILARLFADKAQLGQNIVIDNKAGAGGNIGADFVAKSPADGYTLVMGTVGTHSINGALYSKMPYDMVKDFVPVAHVASAPNLLVVTNELPVKTVAELIACMKANPNKLSFGSPGIGSSVHVSGELFKAMTGTTMQHVPYKGRQFAIPDLVGSTGNATVVEATGLVPLRLLIDCGLGIRQLMCRLGEAGLQPEDIDAVFITHEHGDHIGCARSLALRYRIPVWMSGGTHAAIGSPDFDGMLHTAP